MLEGNILTAYLNGKKNMNRFNITLISAKFICIPLKYT